MRLRREIIVAPRGVQAFSNFGAAIYRSVEIGPPDLLYVVAREGRAFRPWPETDSKREKMGPPLREDRTNETTGLLLYRVPWKPIGRELIATFAE